MEEKKDGQEQKGQPTLSWQTDEEKPKDEKSRLREISEVLRRNHITRGITPEKLRIILEELGPTYIKLGQIMSLHSDILPKEYCDELLKLSCEVTPMPFETVENVINHSYRQDWGDVFEYIDETPLGSASIAQVHRARLLTGEDVVVKVQRKGIYDVMARDIRLLHRLVGLMPSVGDFKNMVDLNMVLDEMWSVAQEEMDFLKEASNMEEFTRNNRDVKYVRVPKLYRQHTTSRVLVMEYIDGIDINDRETLTQKGYDLDEIGSKYVNNFLQQVMDDGFFHADPHPGNVKVCGGKIVWIDMGMMGRLTEKDRRTMIKGVQGIAAHDVVMVENAVLEIGDFRGKPDRTKLYNDIKEFLDQYGSSSMGGLDIADVLMALMEIMKTNNISIPHGVTMLCRGLAHVQGVLVEISPDISMLQIAATRMGESMLRNMDWKKELEHGARDMYRTYRKSMEIPVFAADLLEEILRGDTKFNLVLETNDELTKVAYALVRNIVIGLGIAALLLASAILCTTDMQPQILGIPALGFFGFVFAIGFSAFLVLRNIYYRIRARRRGKRRKKRK